MLHMWQRSEKLKTGGEGVKGSHVKNLLHNRILERDRERLALQGHGFCWLRCCQPIENSGSSVIWPIIYVMFPLHLGVNIVCLDVQCVLWLTTFSLSRFSDFCTCATYHCEVCHIRIVFVLLILLHSRCVLIYYRAICYSIIFVCIACHTLPTTVVCVTEKPIFCTELVTGWLAAACI